MNYIIRAENLHHMWREKADGSYEEIFLDLVLDRVEGGFRIQELIKFDTPYWKPVSAYLFDNEQQELSALCTAAIDFERIVRASRNARRRKPRTK